MGTLTADCPRLDCHCPHKLATSCRLTSTPNCCACADERAHSRTYAVYIDGVGFVQRGTRWQAYCWFCKEFWNNRLAATDPPLEPSQTRIPEIPDQTEFLERWFEFHQGYRIIKLANGTESRVAVIGEPFGEVSPGFLPRTLDQLRAGRENNASRAENRFRRRRLSEEEERPEEPRQTLEEALDSLLAEASDDETPGIREQEVDQASDMPRSGGTGLLRPLTRSERRLQRARDRFVRVFGTREEVQSDDYESPLSTMYNRAMDRYRQAEQRRATGQTMAPPLEGLTNQERREIEDQLVWGVLQESRENLLREERRDTLPMPQNNLSVSPVPPTTNVAPSASLTATSSNSNTASPSSDLRASLEQITNELSRLRMASEVVASARHALHARRNPDPPMSLDNQPNRPPPMTDEQMTKNLACQVCYSHLADIAVLPCGHMVMCQWCADMVIPVKHSHLPVKPSKCPLCRKAVKQRFKIHMGT